MKLYSDIMRVKGIRSPLLYGHFIEHFHRQIYGGVYDPGNSLSDEEGFRTDVIEAMRRIRVPILRWPGGCFVSSYHWMNGVGKTRQPSFDKAWRVEEPNSFGTDEYISLCRKIGCEPYICTNAGTGTAEEMSDWLEYCNLPEEGRYARMRIENGHEKPYGVKYWSIGNENYGSWEIGAKDSVEWSHLATEAAKMMKHVDPRVELSAAALTDLNWNVRLLERCGNFLDWISIHDYWDPIHNTNLFADYDACMVYTRDIGRSVRKVRGLLEAMGLEKQIRIAYDEWNLRGWYHPGVHTPKQALTKEEYLLPRDKNDINSSYTMADAVFTACFLNMVNRNCDIVGMANFAPIVNTRGCIYTYKEGIVLRSSYHVFDLYVNYLGDKILDSWTEDMPVKALRAKDGSLAETELSDLILTAYSDRPGLAAAAVNKDSCEAHELELEFDAGSAMASEKTDVIPSVVQYYISGEDTESCNDIGHTAVFIQKKDMGLFRKGMKISLPPHSVSVIQICP